MAESSAASSDKNVFREAFSPATLKEYEPLTELLSQIPKKVLNCVLNCVFLNILKGNGYTFRGGNFDIDCFAALLRHVSLFKIGLP